MRSLPNRNLHERIVIKAIRVFTAICRKGNMLRSTGYLDIIKISVPAKCIPLIPFGWRPEILLLILNAVEIKPLPLREN